MGEILFYATLFRYLHDSSIHPTVAYTQASWLSIIPAPVGRVLVACSHLQDQVCLGILEEAIYLETRQQVQERRAALLKLRLQPSALDQRVLHKLQARPVSHQQANLLLDRPLQQLQVVVMVELLEGLAVHQQHLLVNHHQAVCSI